MRLTPCRRNPDSMSDVLVTNMEICDYEIRQNAICVSAKFLLGGVSEPKTLVGHCGPVSRGHSPPSASLRTSSPAKADTVLESRTYRF